jgi:F-type H+-transporting ATPase subunit epsilon
VKVLAETLRMIMVTPEREIYNGEAAMVILPAFYGEMGVLPKHMPVMVALRCGEVRIKTSDGVKSYVVDGGLAEVTGRMVKVLANFAEDMSEADPEQASRNIVELEGLLENAELTGSEQDRIKNEILKCKTVIKISERRH